MKLNTIVSWISSIVAVSSIVLLIVMKLSLDAALLKIDILEGKINPMSSIDNSYIDTNTDRPPAPYFELLNKEGKAMGFNDFSKGKRKILVFTTKDCNYCEKYYPELDNFSKEYTNLDVIVIKEGVTVEELKKDSKENSYGFMQLVGTMEIINEYQVEATPTTYLLDEKNNIVRVGIINTKLDLEGFVFKV